MRKPVPGMKLRLSPTLIERVGEYQQREHLQSKNHAMTVLLAKALDEAIPAAPKWGGGPRPTEAPKQKKLIGYAGRD